MNRSQILVVGRDQMLLQTHRLILGTYFAVEAAGRISEAGSILSRRDFDLVVLCDSLNEADRRQIASLVELRKPKPKLLSLLPPGANDHGRLDRRSPMLKGDHLQLLRVCADLLGADLPFKERGVSVNVCRRHHGSGTSLKSAERP